MSAFDPAKLVIERIRFSTTQGEVKLTYDGKLVGQYGDDIELRVSPDSTDEVRRLSWQGHDDAYWQDAARRILGFPPDAIYVQFSDCGKHLRKWSFEPFEGGTTFANQERIA